MSTFTPAYTQIASGLRFPEGPVAMPDGSVVSRFAGQQVKVLTRVLGNTS